MSTGLNITIYDDSGQKQLVDDLKFNSGTIITEEMQKDAPKIITIMQDIKSSDYGIVDTDLAPFDDSLSIPDKIAECRSRIDLYTRKLEYAQQYVQKYGRAEYNELTTNIRILNEQIKEGTASGEYTEEEINEYKYKLKQYNSDLDTVQLNMKNYTKQCQDYPSLIEKYKLFLNDLGTYGDKKPIQKIESIGQQEEEEEVTLDNIDINQAPGMALSREVTDLVSQYLETTVQSLIASGTADIVSKLGINQENIEIAQQILNLMDSTLFKIQSIIKFVPSNIHMMPSAKVAMSNICTSLKDMFDATYISLEQQYYETINDAITNLPSTQEMLKDAQDALLNIALNMIDEQCVKYTGYNIVELYFMCHDLIAKYKYWQQKRKEMKQLREQGYVEAGINLEIDDKAIKAQLMEDLSHASDLLYNAFIIIQIKDAIGQIKELIRQFNNIDLTVLADGIDSLDDLINLLDEIGLNDDSAVLTLKDAIEQGINGFQNQFNSLTKQLVNQGVASGLSIASTAINSAHLQADIGDNQAFSFSNNLDAFEITLNIFQDPTIKKVRKNIISALSNAEDNDGNRIFEANDVLTIIAAIDKGYNLKKDQKVELINTTFIIHFDINGFNLPSTIPYSVYESTTKALQQAEEKRLKEQEEAMESFELGVVTEDFTYDPTVAAKRPTIQLVHELYAVLSEVFPLMKIFAELVSNYKINKAKVEAHSQGNIFGMVKVLAKLNNLLKTCNTNNKNFYTIRTLQMYDYVTQHIKPCINDSPEIQLNIEETRTLHLYLKARSLNYSVVDQKLETIIYIDYDSINEQRKEMQNALDKANGYFGDDASLFVEYPKSKYEDGTTLGLDKVEVAGDEIFYSDSSLPIYASQIMYCYSKDLDVSI